MGKKFLSLKLHGEFDQIKILHLGHLAFLIIALLIEGYIGEKYLSVFIQIILLLVSYKFFYQALLKLYSLFWVIAIFVLLFMATGLITAYMQYESMLLIYAYLFAMCFLFIEVILLFSPIYYPIVRWWEYDFRFRDDLKIKVRAQHVVHEARLTDLRKTAGCVLIFQEYIPGDLVEINYQEKKIFYKFNVEIMSRFHYSLGRPFQYGVKFICQTKKRRKDFQKFSQFWNLEKQSKRELKFKII